MNSKKEIMINIDNTINDPFYRYKMENVMIINHGVKQAFTNIDSICKSINRNKDDLLKFLKKYFGSAFEYKLGFVLTTKKDMSKDDLQSAIFKYIDENVLCKKCRNPETIITKNKKKTMQVCSACSHNEEI